MKPIEKAQKAFDHWYHDTPYTGPEPVAATITAFLDAIQNDPEAMERVILATVAKTNFNSQIGIGNAMLEALKQEVNR